MLVKVLFQLKLPGTVLLSTLMLGHRYSNKEVGALGILFLAVTLFTVLRVGGFDNLSQIEGTGTSVAFGFLYCAAAVGFNVLATLLGEKAFKDNPSVPWYTTVARVKVGETLVALALLRLAVPGVMGNPRSAFKAFSWGPGGVTVFLFLDTWVTCLVVKRLSAVVKAVSKCMSLVVLYVLSLTDDSEAEPAQVATVLIIMATTCYFLVSVQQRRLLLAATASAASSATVLILAMLATVCFVWQQGCGGESQLRCDSLRVTAASRALGTEVAAAVDRPR